MAAAALSFGMLPPAVAGASPDTLQACDAAAAKAERDWGIPAGLLAAIGSVESGRPTFGGSRTVVWPWSVNADGRGFYAPSREAGIETVLALRARGARFIDVGCFQVDLTYHGMMFASLAEAFDPDANAQAAARILAAARLRSSGWAQAVALYHSSAPLRGALYLRQVHAALPAAQSRLAAMPLGGDAISSYAPLLSPQALLVRVFTADSPPPQPLPDLPKVVEISAPRQERRFHEPQIIRLLPSDVLPRVVALPDVEQTRAVSRHRGTGHWPSGR